MSCGFGGLIPGRSTSRCSWRTHIFPVRISKTVTTLKMFFVFFMLFFCPLTPRRGVYHFSHIYCRCCCAQELFGAQQELVCRLRTTSQDVLPAEPIKPVTFCLQDTVFNHQAQPGTSQHGQIPQAAHFTTSAQTAGIYSWWARSVGAWYMWKVTVMV